jgi:hypothetical protein
MALDHGEDAVDKGVGAEQNDQRRQGDMGQRYGENSENDRRHAAQCNQPPSPSQKLKHRCNPPQLASRTNQCRAI